MIMHSFSYQYLPGSNEPKCIAVYKSFNQVVEVLVSGILDAKSLDGSRNDWNNTWEKNPLIFSMK